ncbi:MAG: DUF2231 domain-containing protein [Hyphomicrobiaceae bacterium]|nr:DUF2231 domain-containing protein [Hyphomicrobiaceae bacterium]
MTKQHTHGIESTAQFAGHPVHPMLVPFPIVSIVLALVADLAFLGTLDPFWARGAFWLLAVGLITGIAAAVAGLTDFLTIRPVRRVNAAWAHLLGNAGVVGLVIINLLLRWDDPAAGITGGGLVLSIITVLILLVTGWLGGSLVYSYHLGAMDSPSAGEENRPAARTQGGAGDRGSHR